MCLSVFVFTWGILAFFPNFSLAIGESRIPQMLLPAIHSREVQAELQLSPTDILWLEAQFRELDGPWWRARNLPAAEQWTIVDRQEQELRRRLQDRLTAAQMQRLNELELQAQGMRCLLRADVAEQLKLTAQQQSTLQQLVEETLEREREAQKALAEGTLSEELKLAVARQRQRELTESVALLDREQQKQMQKMLGKKLDLTTAQRVFPMAPEFAANSQWLGTAPVSLRECRGRVVIVHFYAFQCINCQRNFHHYRAWDQRWPSQEVTVVGIQTPETKAERDRELVQRDAEAQDFRFPVIMDDQQANWQAWGNTMWPTVYVIDKQGYIRMWWQGELNWQGATGDEKIAQMVEQLLKE